MHSRKVNQINYLGTYVLSEELKFFTTSRKLEIFNVVRANSYNYTNRLIICSKSFLVCLIIETLLFNQQNARYASLKWSIQVRLSSFMYRFTHEIKFSGSPPNFRTVMGNKVQKICTKISSCTEWWVGVSSLSLLTISRWNSILFINLVLQT